MKFKGIVIGLLAAILAVNTVMAGLLVTEAKKQSEYEYIAAQAIIWDTTVDLAPEGYKENYSEMLQILGERLRKTAYGAETD